MQPILIYTRAALDAVAEHLDALPADVARKVRLAQSVMQTHGYPTPDELRREIGSRNWVVARRTKAIVAKYGPDVITLTPKRYHEAERRALEARFPS